MSVLRLRAEVHTIMHHTVLAIVVLAFILLVVLAAIALLSFGQHLLLRFVLSTPIDPTVIIELLDIVLLVFIVIELLNIAISLIDGRRVVYTVFEAMLVAVARKIIVSGTAPISLEKGASLGLITIAVGVTWWLVTHANLNRVTGAGSPQGVEQQEQRKNS